jgi:hypothetical protein
VTSPAVEVIAPATLVLVVVRIALLIRPPPGVKLPHPSKIGLPSGGMATPAAAHAALTRRSARPWWKFW